MANEMKFQLGSCECPCNIHKIKPDAPVAYEVLRDGKTLKVCTMCVLPTDMSRIQVDHKIHQPEEFDHFDHKGVQLIANTLQLTLTNRNVHNASYDELEKAFNAFNEPSLDDADLSIQKLLTLLKTGAPPSEI